MAELETNKKMMNQDTFKKLIVLKNKEQAKKLRKVNKEK